MRPILQPKTPLPINYHKPTCGFSASMPRARWMSGNKPNFSGPMICIKSPYGQKLTHCPNVLFTLRVRVPHTECAEYIFRHPHQQPDGAGLDILLARLRQMAHNIDTVNSDVVAGTAARCRQSIYNAGESLQSALHLTGTNCAEELIAAEIRTALEELGKVVGAVYTDDVLDRIFSNFCVGK